MTSTEDELAFQLTAVGINFEREYRAVYKRRYRWDFKLPYGFLVEIQGGTWARERTGHSTGAGIRRDCEKNNLAVLNGWKVLLFTSDMVKNGTALATIQEAVKRI